MGGIYRPFASVDLTILDVDTGVARPDGDSARADPAVGDVQLATVRGRNGVTVEADIPIVDVQHPLALTDDGLVEQLKRRIRDSRLPRRRPVTGPRRGRDDAVA